MQEVSECMYHSCTILLVILFFNKLLLCCVFVCVFILRFRPFALPSTWRNDANTNKSYIIYSIILNYIITTLIKFVISFFFIGGVRPFALPSTWRTDTKTNKSYIILVPHYINQEQVKQEHYVYSKASACEWVCGRIACTHVWVTVELLH